MLISVVQYYPFRQRYTNACVIDGIEDKRYKDFMERVNASDPQHQSIVLFLVDDWTEIDVIERCKKMLLNFL